MKKTLALHVGPHRTATTSVQQLLYNIRGDLADHGICYPVICDDRSKINHNNLAGSIRNAEDRATASYLGMIVSQGGSAQQILLSAEEFSNCLNVRMQQFFDRIEGEYDVSYVYVDRDRAELYSSVIIHNIADHMESVARHRSVRAYVTAMAAFVEEQRRLFQLRNTRFLAFSDLKRDGFVNGIAKAAFGVELGVADVRMNDGSPYLDKIASLGLGVCRDLAEFFDDDLVSAPLYSMMNGGGREAQREFASAVQSQVERLIGKRVGQEDLELSQV